MKTKSPAKKKAAAGKPRLTVNPTDEYLEIYDILRKRERYRSPTEVFESFLAHWCISQQPHKLTGAWAILKGYEREQRGRELLALLKSGQSKKGSWLKKLIYDCIKELCGPEAKFPRVDDVEKALPGVLERKLKEEG